MPRPFVRADEPQHLEPVDLRELQIEQHDGGERRAGFGPVARKEVFERLRPVSHDGDVVADAAVLECEERELLVGRVVFDDQNGLIQVLAPDAGRPERVK